MDASEQPTAPYLDAVVVYAFRGPARYHVPGHKGGPGADPGAAQGDRRRRPRHADIPQDIHGIDLGPSPTPYERAERLAAEAFGAERTFFLTNGATQGNHALCLALAPLGARSSRSATRTRRSSTGSCSAAGSRSFVAPEYDGELGITHCVTPAALEAALARGARRPRRVHRLADLLRHGGRHRGPGGGRARARACRSSSTSRGGRTSASTTSCRRPRCRRARTRCSRARTRSPAR